MRSHIKQLVTRSLAASASVLFGLVFVLNALPVGSAHASANELGQRSLTISSSANGNTNTDIGGTPENPGQGGNGQKTSESFSFVLPSGSSVGSMDFLYCTTPLPGTTCTAPTGLDTSHVASIQTQGGWTSGTGTTCTAAPFSFGSATTNEIKVAAASACTENSTGALTISFGGQTADYIVNPTSDNTTFFVRITIFSDTGYSTAVDQGTVASSTAQQVDVTAKVQETLNFSVGTYDNGLNTTDHPNAPGSTCAALGGTGDSSGLTLGDPTNGVLSATQAYDAHSYFRLSTNAFNGASVEYSGDTLHSGTSTITAIGTSPLASAVGSPQFGIALDSSDSESGNGYSLTNLTPAASYANGAGTITNAGTAKFAFDPASVTTPVPVATSASVVVCDTGSVRYLGNIAYSTTAGIYTTNISYLVVPTY